MPYVRAQSATSYLDLLDKLVEFLEGRSAQSLVIAAGGTGYAVNDVLTLSGGTSTIAGQLIVTSVSSGVITGVRISQSGVYTSIPSNDVAVTGGGGSGATFTVTWTAAGDYVVNRRSQEAVSATIPAAGSGHAIGDTLTVVGGVDVDTAPTFDIATALAVSGTVNAGGTGYTVNDKLTLSGGTSTTAAVFNVDSVSGGVVTGLSVDTAGDYSVLPGNPVSTTGGTGTGCTIDVSWGALTVTLNAAGRLGETPSNPASTTSSGSGTGTTLTVTYQDHTSTDFDVLFRNNTTTKWYGQIRSYTSGSARNWELRGATGYTSANPFGTQPGISPGDHESAISSERQGCYVPLDNSAVTYWFYKDTRHVKGVIKVGAATYTNFYMGYLDQFGTDTNMPFPLCIAGCVSEYTRLFSSTDTGYSGMCDPISDDTHDTAGPMVFRVPGGTWEQVHNSQGNGGSRSSKTDFVVFPCGQLEDGSLSSDDKWSANQITPNDFIPNSGSPGTVTYEWKQTPETPDEISLVWPAMLAQASPREVHGEMVGVFWTSADIDGAAAIAVSEDTLTDASTGDVYDIFQNCNRTENFTYFALKLE